MNSTLHPNETLIYSQPTSFPGNSSKDHFTAEWSRYLWSQLQFFTAALFYKIAPAHWPPKTGKTSNIINLEHKWPLFLKVNPPKQGLVQSKQGSFGFQDNRINVVRDATYKHPAYEKKQKTRSEISPSFPGNFRGLWWDEPTNALESAHLLKHLRSFLYWATPSLTSGSKDGAAQPPKNIPRNTQPYVKRDLRCRKSQKNNTASFPRKSCRCLAA